MLLILPHGAPAEVADAAGDAIRAGLEDEGVDVSELRLEAGARSIESAILVEGGNRTIVTYLGTLAPVELSPRARELCLRRALKLGVVRLR